LLFDKFKPNTQYTLLFYVAGGSTGNTTNLRVFYTDGTTNAGNINYEPQTDHSVKRKGMYVTTAGKSVDRIQFINMAGNQYLLYEESGIYEGIITEEKTESYKGEALTSELPETVYGGTLDWNTGVLTITHGCIESYAGEEVPEGWISSVGALTEGA
jgi:hypothetical protein